MYKSALLLIFLNFLQNVVGQADGNPHNWDRTRRCDQQDYDPPCQPCEGIGGIPYGSENSEIELTTCQVVAKPDEIVDPVRPVWGTKWTLPLAYEILIGKKTDPACFQTFPGADSIGDLCYRKQTGSKVYDMYDSLAIREDLELETVVGNITSTVIHQGKNFWVVNKFPWYAGGIHQCICTHIREVTGDAGGDQEETFYYPVQYNWVNKMVYMGREIIGIEYIGEEREMDHWAFGPHHLWSEPTTGAIIRMWQPFNGLQVYPSGVGESDIDSSLFDDIPPALCKSGFQGALIRIGCDDDGYPTTEDTTTTPSANRSPRDPVSGKDIKRAEEKVPRGHYKGMDFSEMSDILNGWLNTSTLTKPCLDWDVKEIQQLQALFYLARDSQFDEIYTRTTDNRRMRHDLLSDLSSSWAGLNKIADTHQDYRMKNVRRDGHCHEAVMWYVHHLTQDMKDLLAKAKVPIPLLSPSRHGFCDTEALDSEGHKICGAYREQVTCASCHSNELPPGH